MVNPMRLFDRITRGPTSVSERLHLRQGKKAGMQPGALVHIGQRSDDKPRITVIEYDLEVFAENELASLADAPPNCRNHPDRKTNVWINVDGISDADFIADLGRRFDLHPLVLEDVMNAGERPKLEEYDDCLFCVLKMVDVDAESELLLIEQVSLVLGKDFVITFQERSGDVFNGVRERIRLNKGRIRKMGADYLLYALTDAIVDHYAVALDTMTGLVEDLESRLQRSPEDEDISDIYTLKREVLFLRRQILPARDVVGQLARHEDDELVTPAVDIFFRDVLDHLSMATDTVDTLRDLTVSMIELFHTQQSARLNEVMRVLTIISTFFIPLTFIAGIYGMNFEHMPELHSPHGYFICLAVMAVVGVGMVLYMKRNRWL